MDRWIDWWMDRNMKINREVIDRKRNRERLSREDEKRAELGVLTKGKLLFSCR